jgi:hypothetical protein
MHRIVRQMILGLGTFGTGTALLFLDVNPYLLVLTDTVVGVGMLFAAGSLTMSDLRHPRKGPGEEELIDEVGSTAGGHQKASGGLRESFERLGKSLRPSMGRPGAGKEEKETRTKKIDEMLDSAIVGQSRNLISIAEGRAGSAGPSAAAGGTMGQAGGVEEFLAADPSAPPALDDEPEEGDSSGQAAAVQPSREEVPASALFNLQEMKEEAQGDALPLSDGELGAEDLLSALRREAMKEKKRDDTSLLRELKGVKVSGRQLLEELDSLVRDIRRR